MTKIQDAALALRDSLDDANEDYEATAIQLSIEGQTIVAATDEHGDTTLFILKQAPTCATCGVPPRVVDDHSLQCQCGNWPGRWDA